MLCARLAVSLLFAIPVLAQGPPATGPWIPVIKFVPDGVEVVGRLVPTPQGAELEFVNRGTQPIHFEFYFPASQTVRDKEHNKRIHLRPGASSGVLTRSSSERIGYEALFANGKYTGGLYLSGKTFGQPVAPALSANVVSGDWFTLEVIAQGNRLKVLVDGKEIPLP